MQEVQQLQVFQLRHKHGTFGRKKGRIKKVSLLNLNVNNVYKRKKQSNEIQLLLLLGF